MKSVLAILIALCPMLLFPAFTACSPDNNPLVRPDGPPGEGGAGDGSGSTDGPFSRTLRIVVGGTSFPATLEEHAAARAFAARLPLRLEMEELNGNEKYCYLDEHLPASASRPGTIRAGDLMLYGSNGLVLFYETFSSPYSYTRLGRVDDPAGLASALGRGRVTVVFERGAP